ncbi:hypothetical protein E5D57_012104 [Metarhizium anisopliae]|nr:hypothetical protein E5D57_012104 [Metarhizium anisopliae]
MSDAQYPGAFTNVGSYMSFIEEYRGSNGRPDPNAPSRVKFLQEAAKKVISEDEVFEHCDRTGQSRQDCYEAKKPCDTQRREKPHQTHEEYFQCIDEEVIKWQKFLGEYDDQAVSEQQELAALTRVPWDVVEGWWQVPSTSDAPEFSEEQAQHLNLGKYKNEQARGVEKTWMS